LRRTRKSHSAGSDAEQRGHLEVSVVVVGKHDYGRSDDVAQGPHGRHGAYAHGQRGGDHGRAGAGDHVHGVPDAAPRVDARVRERGGVAPGYDVVRGCVLPGSQVALEPVLDQRKHEHAEEPDGHGRGGAPRPVLRQQVYVHQHPRDPPVGDHRGRDDGRG